MINLPLFVYPVGNTQTQSLQDIWNGEQMRELRMNMLHDKPSKECRRCYELEENGMGTLRQGSIRDRDVTGVQTCALPISFFRWISLFFAYDFCILNGFVFTGVVSK